MIDGSNPLSWPEYKPKSSHQLGAKDQIRTLERVLQDRIPAYGLICVADDPQAVPRSIKGVRTNCLIRLQITRSGERYIGNHLENIPFAQMVKDAWARESPRRNGLDDLLVKPEGCEAPDRALQVGFKVKRDPKVREYVIQRANGRCEYCGKQGFELKSGGRYVEAHHIILLAHKGPDTVENVIALCPDHHREAHYGLNAERLEREFEARLSEINSRISQAR